MCDFGGGLAFDLVDSGWFQAAWGGCDRYSNRFDIKSTLTYLPCRGQIPHFIDTILAFLPFMSGSSTLHVQVPDRDVIAKAYSKKGGADPVMLQLGAGANEDPNDAFIVRALNVEELGTRRQSGRFLFGAFLRSGRPRGPGEALKNVGGRSPPHF